MSAYNDAQSRGFRSADLRINLAELGAFLRRTYPTMTAANVEADTGISARTVQGWLEARSKPNAIAVLRMAAHYGPEFLAAAYDRAPAWLAAARRQVHQQRLDDAIDALLAEREALEMRE